MSKHKARFQSMPREEVAAASVQLRSDYEKLRDEYSALASGNDPKLAELKARKQAAFQEWRAADKAERDAKWKTPA